MRADRPAGSALTEKMHGMLQRAEREAFHKLAYQTSKSAIVRHDVQRDREKARVGGPATRSGDRRNSLTGQSLRWRRRRVIGAVE